MSKHAFILMAALALGGCGKDNGGMNPDGGGNTTPPGPVATHVGATGTTGGLVTDGDGHAAYLLNPTTVMSGQSTIGVAGELHVVSADGTDIKVAANVFERTYVLAPDGKSLFYIGFDPTNGPKNGTASLNYLSLASAGATPKTIVTTGMPVTNVSTNPFGGAVYTVNPLTQESFFSPSSKYFVVGIAVAKESTTPDMHVIDTRTGMDVYQRPNGAYVYLQLVLPDDTMIFQDTAGGTGPSTTPVQTLYWVTLPGGSPPAAITTHTAQFTPTADNKTLVILKTGGELLTWDLANKNAAPKPLATGAALYTLGNDAKGPVAWVGADGSVHVITTDGDKLLDLDAATAKADVFGTIRLSPSGSDVYFWQNAEQQNNRGTLLRAAVASGAKPAKIADKVSIPDLTITDQELVFLQNVDDVGKFGDAAAAPLDGSKVAPLGTKAPVSGLRVANPAAQSWFGLHLTGATADGTNVPIDGSPAITGALALAGGATGPEVTLDATVHQGAFGFADDGRAVVFASGAAWNATAKNWVGALSFVATGAPATKIDGKVAGVSEIGRIAARKLFVNAPGATPAGVYFVTY